MASQLLRTGILVLFVVLVSAFLSFQSGTTNKTIICSVQDSRRPFWPVGCRLAEAQDGCQNGQQWLDALGRDVPYDNPDWGLFFTSRGSPEANGGLRTAGASAPIYINGSLNILDLVQK